MITNKRQILREYQELRCSEKGCQDLLNESEKQMSRDGHLIFPAKLQEANARNGNGRIYPRKVLEREISKYQQLIEENRALGELEHSDSEIINLNNCSHRILRIWWNGNDVIGTVKVLNTPKGQILKELYNDGTKFGFSSRALGSLQESQEGSIVQDDLDLVCFDAVSTPSAPNAFVLRESQIKNKLSKLFESIRRG